jgi:hypothetical protein
LTTRQDIIIEELGVSAEEKFLKTFVDHLKGIVSSSSTYFQSTQKEVEEEFEEERIVFKGEIDSPPIARVRSLIYW